MEKIVRLLPVIVASVVTGICVALNPFEILWSKAPVIGQSYSICFDCEDDNPFSKKETDTLIVTDVKDGYVQFYWKEFGDYKRSSTTVHFINKHCKKVALK